MHSEVALGCRDEIVRLPAPVFVGWWSDHHQSYTAPLWIFTEIFGLGSIAFVAMRRPRQAEQATLVGLVEG